MRVTGAEVYVEYVQNDNVTNISARRVACHVIKTSLRDMDT
jgi:hypothetical protein